MSRRRVRLVEELPPPAKKLLRSIGVDLAEVQDWLDTHRTDGCTLAPDLYLVVCAWHDWACRATRIPRVVVDLVAALMLFQVARYCQDEQLWRWCGYFYAVLFFCGVRTGALLRVGRSR